MSFMHDTSPEAERVYYDIIARMTPGQRLAQANRLSVRMRSLVLESIQEQHPEFSKRETQMAYCQRIMTDGEFKTLFAGTT